MSLENILPNDVTEQHLEQLIAGGVQESVTIDYKAESYLYDDSGKRELLKDVTGFTNTLGGYLVLGMTAIDGTPTNLSGLAGVVLDKELLRLESIVRDGIEPRIFGLTIRGINLVNGNSAIIISIPRSWNPPHRVNYKGWNKYFARSSAATYELSVTDLRSVFLQSANLERRIQEFRLDRIAKIKVGGAPAPVINEGQMVIHIVPMASGVARIDVGAASKDFVSFRPRDSISLNYRINFDGLLVTSVQNDGRIPCYTQLFSDGSIEAVIGKVCYQGDKFKGLAYPFIEKEFFEFVEYRCKALVSHGIRPPVVIMMTLIGVKGTVISLGPFSMREQVEVDRDDLLTPPVTLLDFDFAPGWHSRFQDPINSIYNAYGIAKSPNFDGSGLWTSPR